MTSSNSKKKKAVESAVQMFANAAVPIEHRKMLLKSVIESDGEESKEILGALVEAVARGEGESAAAQKAAELAAAITELQNGPLRPATFLASMDPRPGSPRRAQVLLQNGDAAYPLLLDDELAGLLTSGDGVLIDAQARAILFREPLLPPVGEEARLEWVLDNDRVEGVVRDHEKFVFRATKTLRDKIASGEAAPGAKMLVCQRRAMAFDVVPQAKGLSHYQYLIQEPPPDVIAARDIGSPPLFIEELTTHVRDELRQPDVGRRYGLRRATTKLLTGVSGSGKSLAIRALWRNLYEIMADETGIDLQDLPYRVVKIRMATLLSKWLGESDANVDRLFNEIEQLANETFETADGRRIHLPLLVIGEEIDGLSRARNGHDEVYGRIQTTLLERLDVGCDRLGDRLVVFVFTSNVPHLVDSAFLRRAGGSVEHFGRLNRKAFASVLQKHLALRPIAHLPQESQEAARRRTMQQVIDFLFAPGSDSGQVETTYVGSSTPIRFYRRDFLTGAMVDRAVQKAAAAACREERTRLDAGQTIEGLGISGSQLLASFRDQVDAVVNQLSDANLGNYVTLPDGVRPGPIIRIPQPVMLSSELQRSRS